MIDVTLTKILIFYMGLFLSFSRKTLDILYIQYIQNDGIIKYFIIFQFLYFYYIFAIFIFSLALPINLSFYFYKSIKFYSKKVLM